MNRRGRNTSIYRNADRFMSQLLVNCSERQRAVAFFVVAGYRDVEIARALGLSRARIGQHRKRLRAKAEQLLSDPGFEELVRRFT